MERRDFIKLGLSAITAGCVSGIPPVFKVTKALAARQTVTLDITEVFHEMVDLTQVYSWAYAGPVSGPNIPGPVIFATDGELIRIRINNTLDEPHGLAISGLFEGSFLINSGPIPPGQSRTLAFPAPPPGTYTYEDPVNFPVNRVLGLHGMLIVMPRAAVTGNALTPYRDPTPVVQQLFNDLGNSAHFPPPGIPWKPERTTLWVFSEIDPVYNEMASLNQVIDPGDFRLEFFAPLFHHERKERLLRSGGPGNGLEGLGRRTYLDPEHPRRSGHPFAPYSRQPWLSACREQCPTDSRFGRCFPDRHLDHAARGAPGHPFPHGSPARYSGGHLGQVEERDLHRGLKQQQPPASRSRETGLSPGLSHVQPSGDIPDLWRGKLPAGADDPY